MQTQYQYARDKRSDHKYQSDFYAGTYNQELAIQQFILDRYITNGSTLEYEPNPDKTFQRDDGGWVYSPDYILYRDSIAYPLEVKVQMSKLGDTIDFKCSQIYRLIELDGYILYATKIMYALITPRSIKLQSEVIDSERFGGKKVFQFSTNLVDWQVWVHYPEFKGYTKWQK